MSTIVGVKCRHSRMFIIAAVLFLLFSCIPLGDVGGEEVSENRTRAASEPNGNRTAPDFDVQFMLDPSTDPLDPLRGEKWVKLEPGTSAEYWVLISNFGQDNSTFIIELDEPPRDAGWRWYFMETRSLSTNATLLSPHIRDEIGGVSFKIFRIHIVSPIDARKVTKLALGITSYSISSEENVEGNITFDRDEMTFVLGHTGYLFPMVDSEGVYYLRPGESIDVKYMMTNLGNKDFLNLNLRIDEERNWRTSYRSWEELYIPKSDQLKFNWTEINISVPNQSTYRTSLSITAPGYTCRDDFVFRFRFVTALTDANYQAHYSEIITIIVNSSMARSFGSEDRVQDHVDISLTMEEDSDGLTLDLNDLFLVADSETVTYRSSGNNLLNVSIEDGIALIRSPENWFGWEIINITARDGEFNESVLINVTVIPVNDPPSEVEILGSDHGTEGKDLVLQVTASDPDLPYNDHLIAFWSSNITGYLGEGDVLEMALPAGTHLITVTITDLHGLSIDCTIEIVIHPVQTDIDPEPRYKGKTQFPWGTTIAIFICTLMAAGFLLLAIKMKRERVHEEEIDIEKGEHTA
ncbi:MAG: hypothetical protein KAH57_01640 [Thermoplasmata archaeon]|nr:hypothetical protein [Thermoplasmata archaeon]